MKYTHNELEKFLNKHLGKEFPYKYKKLILMMMDNFRRRKVTTININLSKCIRELYGSVDGKPDDNRRKYYEMKKIYSSSFTLIDRLAIFIRKLDDETIYRMFHYEIKGDHITCKQFFLLLFERYGMR